MRDPGPNDEDGPEALPNAGKEAASRRQFPLRSKVIINIIL